MSQTLAVTEDNVRALNGDQDAASYGLPSERLRVIIRGIVRRWAMWLAVPELWDLGIYTIAAGDNEDNSGVEYNRIVALRNSETGKLMTSRTSEQLDALRDGEVPSNPILGAPRAYAMTDLTGLTYIKVYPGAKNDTNIDALVSNVVPETLTDATSYSFSKHAMTGIEAQAAAEASRAMKPGDRERLGITPEAVSGWMGVAAEVLAGEKTRLGRMRDPSHIPAQVN